jgi:anaerobic ribonucleoside-triphosphate reductase
LNALWLDKIVPFYREVIAKSLQAQFEEQLIDYQTQEHLARNQKADLIKQKYELITREYNQQFKNFDSKHKQICDEETQRKHEIVSNFENHIKQIRDDMFDAKQQAERQEIIDETKMLTEKYNALEIDCNEKIALMHTSAAQFEE